MLKLLGRVLITAFAMGVASFLVGLPLYVLAMLNPELLPMLDSSAAVAVPLRIVSLLLPLLAAWYTWRKTAALSHGPLSSMMYGAFLVGFIGFAAGFFGPILLTPDANQGPLLGIFITGPIGVVVGAIAGFLYGRERAR